MAGICINLNSSMRSAGGSPCANTYFSPLILNFWLIFVFNTLPALTYPGHYMYSTDWVQYWAVTAEDYFWKRRQRIMLNKITGLLDYEQLSSYMLYSYWI
jgi:hypothetical protein